MRRKALLATAAAAALVFTLSGPVLPAMEPEAVDVLTQENPDFAQGRRAIEARDWKTAIKWLASADKRTPNNADIQNLLGFAYRNSGQVEQALKHYQRALQIDPRHRGAHEYIGEAYLMTNNVAKAEEHLAALKRVCSSVCEEREDLSRKIAQYRSRGK
jgi:tetratricopeptide (TPR) repeat protein